MPTKQPEKNRFNWLYLRRGTQIAFFLLFLVLFLKAEYVGQEILTWPVDLFFRFDPLILAANLLTLSPLVWGLFWSLVLVGLTLGLGRFFCGWVCPLGTTLDGFRRLLFRPRPDSGLAARWRRFSIISCSSSWPARPFLSTWWGSSTLCPSSTAPWPWSFTRSSAMGWKKPA